MPTLLEIGEEMRRLDAMLDQLDNGEIPNDEVGAALDAMFASAQENLERKLDGYAALIKSYQLRAVVRRSAREQLDKHIKADEGRADRLKDRLQNFFEEHGLKTVNTDRFRVALCGNGGRVPIEITVPPEKLHPDFQRLVVEPDLEAIHAAIKEGQQIEGVTVKERGRHMRIT
jgi:hypothetical protein